MVLQPALTELYFAACGTIYYRNCDWQSTLSLEKTSILVVRSGLLTCPSYRCELLTVGEYGAKLVYKRGNAKRNHKIQTRIM
jgi:hypothetical protein